MITLLVLGGIGLLLALTIGLRNPNAVPTCDGQPMGQRDTCHIYSSGGGSGSYTYGQMVDRQKSPYTMWRVIGLSDAGVCVLLVVPVARTMNPTKPWGRPLDRSCPRCGRNTLQERKTPHRISPGGATHSHTGIVTLCTPECGYATVRQP